MKVLHLTYRFGKDIVGGAETYLYMLSRTLVEKGINVDVVTTKTKHLEPIARFGVKWDNLIDKDHEVIDGINVYRFNTYNLPDFLALKFNYLLQTQWDKEEDVADKETVRNLKGNFLGTGWYYTEKYDQFKMRWSKQQATFAISESNISSITFEIYCPKKINGKLIINGIPVNEFSASDDWKGLYFDISKISANKLFCEIILDNTWHPPNDPRKLGIAVRNIKYYSGGNERLLDLDDHYSGFRYDDKDLLISELFERAKNRPKINSYLFQILRGPIAPSMWSFLNKKVKEYDIILGHMTPYSTLNYAVYFGNKYKKPVVLLPHFHVDDDFYHWEHYYKAFKKADIVLAMSEYSKEKIFDRVGANSVFVGAGITPSDYESVEISGNRFRNKFNLNNVPIILFVGRKSFPKRYDMLIKAIELINKDISCKLVMIGPDEDKKKIESENVLYVGKADKSTLMDAYDACDMFAMMSESESFGIVFLEAWMRKKPVIGNKNCGPVASLIADGIDGFLCSNEIDLADRLLELLHNKELSLKMGRYGYEKTVNHYTWDNIAEIVKNIYKDQT